MSRPLDLDDDQRLALMKFRHNVSDCTLPQGSDDFYLLRWLRARNFNINSAEKMLRESLRWKEKFDMDRLNWTPPEVLVQYFPGGVCGVDKDQIPVLVFPVNREFDVPGMVQASSRQDYVKMVVTKLETILQEASRISRDLGRPSSAPQIFVIFDLLGFELTRLTSKLAIDVMLSFTRILEANFPEVLKKSVFINAPSVFSILFAILKPFLDANTMRKVQFFGDDQSKWQAHLLEHIEADQLPVYLGGCMTGPGDDPRCSDKICAGGIIPKAMYRKD